MEAQPTPLTSDQAVLLRQLVSKHASYLTPVVEEILSGRLVAASDSTALEEMLSGVLVREELMADYEPTTYGARIDELASACAQYSRAYWV